MATIPSVFDIWSAITEWAPREFAESWDSIGLQVGDPAAPVHKILVVLDPTENALGEAERTGADLVVAHHPLLFRPVTSLDISLPVPGLAARFLRSGIALLACHTNLDSVSGGVSDLLAGIMGLEGLEPLRPLAGGLPGGLGRIGGLPEVLTLAEVVERLARSLAEPCLRVVGDPKTPVRKIAVCGGSGSDLWPDVLSRRADLYVSAELKHHVAREAEYLQVALVDAGHFATEWLIVPALAEYLERSALARGWEVKVEVFEGERSPFGCIIPDGQGTFRHIPGSRPGLFHPR
ncbi:MAG: Nif3-like dinuclear metal center hexameric protein [Deltaproteobacteria bacterium]